MRHYTGLGTLVPKLLAAGAAAALGAGCQLASGGTITMGDSDLAKIERGAAVADEPLATQAGREILMTGGNAVDAAVAMAGVMAVTLPSRAGFGGGGLCLVFDGSDTTVRTLDFLPRGTGGAAGPAMLTGLATLHAEYGTRNFDGLMGQVEELARFGHPVSRALATDLAAVEPVLGGDPDVTAIFGRPGGGLVGEGATIAQSDLADMLTTVRAGGLTAVASGPLTAGYAEAAAAAGNPLSPEVGSRSFARWTDPILIEDGSDQIWFAREPEAGGAAAALIWAMLAEAEDYDDVDAEERPHLMAEAMARALAAGGTVGVVDEDAAEALLSGYSPDRATAPDAGRAGDASFGASLAAFSGNYLRKTELGVACAFTMNGLFGSGRIAPGTGMFVAGPEQPGVQAVGGVALMINEPTDQLVYAGAGSDLLPGLITPMVETLVLERSLVDAMSAARVMPDFSSDAVLVERTAIDALGPTLERRGHQVRGAAGLGRGTAIYCTSGSTFDEKTCYAAADPRGYGLATVVEP